MFDCPVTKLRVTPALHPQPYFFMPLIHLRKQPFIRLCILKHLSLLSCLNLCVCLPELILKSHESSKVNFLIKHFWVHKRVQNEPSVKSPINFSLKVFRIKHFLCPLHCSKLELMSNIGKRVLIFLERGEQRSNSAWENQQLKVHHFISTSTGRV